MKTCPSCVGSRTAEEICDSCFKCVYCCRCKRKEQWRRTVLAYEAKEKYTKLKERGKIK